MEVLERIGVMVAEPSAVELLRQAGAEVVDSPSPKKIVKIPESLVRDQLKKAPRSFTLYGRDPDYKLILEGGRVYFCGTGTLIYVLDQETGQRRKAIVDDVSKFAKLQDYLEYIHHVSLLVWPNDVSTRIAHAYLMRETFKNTRKTIEGWTYGTARSMDSLKMAAVIAGGMDALEKRPMLLGVINPVSPLQHSQDMTEGLIAYAKRGQPVMVASAAQAGATAPVTLAGVLVQHNAEVLTGIVMAELVRPGCPVIYGSFSTILDQKSANIATGAGEFGLLNVAIAQLAGYYGLPSRGTGGTTDSKQPDIQAGMEKAITLLMAALGGVNLVYHSAGSLDTVLTASYETLVLDNELCGIVSRVLQGIKVNPETLAADVIARVGPTGHFLSQKHTMNLHAKEHFMPRLLNRTPWAAWEKAGSKTALDAAREEVKKILSTYHPSQLDKDQIAGLDAVVAEAEKRELGV